MHAGLVGWRPWREGMTLHAPAESRCSATFVGGSTVPARGRQRHGRVQVAAARGRESPVRRQPAAPRPDGLPGAPQQQLRIPNPRELERLRQARHQQQQRQQAALWRQHQPQAAEQPGSPEGRQRAAQGGHADLQGAAAKRQAADAKVGAHACGDGGARQGRLCGPASPTPPPNDLAVQARKVKHRPAGVAEEAAMDAALWGHLATECGLDEAWRAQVGGGRVVRGGGQACRPSGRHAERRTATPAYPPAPSHTPLHTRLACCISWGCARQT